MKTPHRHEALIKAWADGANIEVLYKGIWQDVVAPQWDKCEYRIKPESKPDIVQHISINAYGRIEYLGRFSEPENLQLTFDGETGKLKAAEVIA